MSFVPRRSLSVRPFERLVPKMFNQDDFNNHAGLERGMMTSMIKAHWPIIAVQLTFTLATTGGIIYFAVWAIKTLAAGN